MVYESVGPSVLVRSRSSVWWHRRFYGVVALGLVRVVVLLSSYFPDNGGYRRNQEGVDVGLVSGLAFVDTFRTMDYSYRGQQLILFLLCCPRRDVLPVSVLPFCTRFPHLLIPGFVMIGRPILGVPEDRSFVAIWRPVYGAHEGILCRKVSRGVGWSFLYDRRALGISREMTSGHLYLGVLRICARWVSRFGLFRGKQGIGRLGQFRYQFLKWFEQLGPW